MASLPLLGALAHEEHLSCRAGQGLVSVACQGPAPEHKEQGRHLKIQAAAQFSPGVLVGKAPAALLTITS